MVLVAEITECLASTRFNNHHRSRFRNQRSEQRLFSRRAQGVATRTELFDLACWNHPQRLAKGKAKRREKGTSVSLQRTLLHTQGSAFAPLQAA